jgi:hypothetical protein
MLTIIKLIIVIANCERERQNTVHHNFTFGEQLDKREENK